MPALPLAVASNVNTLGLWLRGSVLTPRGDVFWFGLVVLPLVGDRNGFLPSGDVLLSVGLRRLEGIVGLLRTFPGDVLPASENSTVSTLES